VQRCEPRATKSALQNISNVDTKLLPEPFTERIGSVDSFTGLRFCSRSLGPAQATDDTSSLSCVLYCR
jgi:hypothetical protein